VVVDVDVVVVGDVDVDAAVVAAKISRDATLSIASPRAIL
jgi:hypothetical protein